MIRARDPRLSLPESTGVWAVIARWVLHQDTPCRHGDILRIRQCRNRSDADWSSRPAKSEIELSETDVAVGVLALVRMARLRPPTFAGWSRETPTGISPLPVRDQARLTARCSRHNSRKRYTQFMQMLERSNPRYRVPVRGAAEAGLEPQGYPALADKLVRATAI